MKKYLAILGLIATIPGCFAVADAREPDSRPDPMPRYYHCDKLGDELFECTTCYYTEVYGQCVCNITLTDKP